MTEQRIRYKNSISKYVPSEFVDSIIDLLIQYPVRFRIVKPRKTKLGDFRATQNGDKHQITINGNLNPYSFLITTIHEFAHLITYDEYGRKAKPHGVEWQHNYRKLLLPIVDSNLLPDDLEKALVKSLINVKASSCTDIHLARVLLKYDAVSDNTVPLEALDKNSIFALNGKVYKKGQLRRTRYVCEEEKSKKRYLVNALAPVIRLENEK